jgi:beta-glucanase (GH16 family)
MRIAMGAAAAVAAAMAGYAAQAAPAGAWKQVWSDEFTVPGLPDPAKWDYETGYVRNDEKQFYTRARSQNARVENGSLIIEARKEAYEGSGYTSASLHTAGKGDWLYGRVEARARLPGGKGMWPAIWMLPTASKYGTWPKSGEIDIMENVGFDPKTVHFTVHTDAYNHTRGTQKGGSVLLPDPQRDFHVYAAEWDAEKIVFQADGKEIFVFRKEGAGSAVWPFDDPFHLKLNVAVGGSWGGAIDDAIFPQRMEVDYVRVFAWDASVGIRARAGTRPGAMGAGSIPANPSGLPWFSASGRSVSAPETGTPALRLFIRE